MSENNQNGNNENTNTRESFGAAMKRRSNAFIADHPVATSIATGAAGVGLYEGAKRGIAAMANRGVATGAESAREHVTESASEEAAAAAFGRNVLSKFKPFG